MEQQERNALLEELKEALRDELTDEISEIVMDAVTDSVTDAIMDTVQGIKDDETAKDRLYVLSQDKKLLAPITYAEVQKARGNNPKAADYPFVITARIGIFTNQVFGWYQEESAAVAELQNLVSALKQTRKDQYTVYEMK